MDGGEGEEYLSDDDLFRGAKNQPYHPDLHLKTAIRIDERKDFLNTLIDDKNVSNYTVRTSVECYKKCPEYKEGEITIDSETTYGTLLHPLYVVRDIPKQRYGSLDENLLIAKRLAYLQSKIYLGESATPEELRDLKERVKSIELPRWIRKWYAYRNAWEALRDNMKDKQMRRNFEFSTVNSNFLTIPITYNSYFAIVKLPNQKQYLLDYSQILMISDTVTSRYLSLLYSLIQDYMKLNTVPSWTHLLNLYNWGDYILQELGNDGYNSIKQLEPITIATYMEKWEPLTISTDYYSQLIQEIEDPRVREDISQLHNLLYIAGSHPNILIEIFGCYRHFGHPTVDEIGGVESLRENSTKKIPLRQDCLDKVTGAFNRMVTIEFIKKHRRWPKCSLPPELHHTDLYKLVQNKPNTLSDHDLSLPLQDWSALIFGQEFQFDDYPDFTALLSDKALSPYQQNWFSTFNKDILKYRHPDDMTESRRVLVEVLKRPEVSCKKIRETVQNREVPESWYVVGLHSKERELKIKARLFAMMCLEMRLYFNMTEKNIAEKIFPYVPYQTMTWSDAEINRVMLNLSSLSKSHSDPKFRKRGKRKCVYVTISLDFNKFNQRWRKESTEGIFRSIDRLFGTDGLYTFSHEFFEKAFFYLSSNLHPPDFLRAKTKEEARYKDDLHTPIFISETTWKGQAGGCEGLRQKGWTGCIASALIANALITGIHGTIIGQGDNQIILAEFPIEDPNMSVEEYINTYEHQLSQRIKEYLRNLEEITSGIGMELKLQESWASVKLLNYGKEILVDGCFMSNALKKISRTFSDVSELYPSLQNRVAALFTSAQSTAMKSYDIIVPYFIATLDTLYMLTKESEFGTTMNDKFRKILENNKLKLDISLKMFMMLLPRECGGLPVATLPSLAYRGHADPMTLSLEVLKQLAKEEPIAKEILDMISSGYLLSERNDPVHLIQDPLSINFRKPTQSSNKAKKMLVSAMEDITANKDVKMMMEACNQESLTQMAEYLTTMTPFNPRIANEILRLSPDGSMLSFLAIFQDMRTMKQLLSAKDANHLVEELAQGDVDVVTYIIKLYKDMKNKRHIAYLRGFSSITDTKEWLEKAQKCSSQLVQNLRDSSWNLEISGVTTPHPLEQSRIHRATGEVCSYEGCTGDENIIYVVMQVPGDETTPLIFNRGPLNPYYGSGTSEKRSGAVVIYPKSEKALRAAQQLSRVLNWVIDQDEPNNTLPGFLQSLIASRCNASEDFLVLTAGVNYGGSVQHRFSDVTTKHESRPGIRVNNHTRVVITSDELGKYARGKFNYPIVFQADFLWALSRISHLLSINPDMLKDGNVAFHQHYHCDSCLPILEEPPIFSREKPPHVATLKDCPLIYTDIDEGLGSIPIECLEQTETIVPLAGDKDIHRKASYAASLVVLGALGESVTPMVHSSLRTQFNEGTFISLTVGFFSSINIKVFFESLTGLWFLDNLPAILRVQKIYGGSLTEAAELHVESFPDSAWDILKPFLCLREVQQEARRKLGLVSTSSEIYITGAGLGYAINHLMARIIRKWSLTEEERSPNKYLKIPFVTSAPGITLNRCIYLWVNSCIVRSNWSSYDQLDVLLQYGQLCIQESIKQDHLDLGKLVISLTRHNLGNMSLIDSWKGNKLVISKVGVEPWIVPRLLQSAAPKTVGIVRDPPQNTDERSRATLKAILVDIPYPVNVPLHSDSEIGNSITLPNKVETETMRMHTRYDHKYRLVGEYSTAALKYLQIFVHENVTNPDTVVHLAEGAAGISRSSARILGAKTIIYNSLMPLGESLNHRSYDFRPAELQDLEGVKIIGPKLCYITGGDITSENTILLYRHTIKELSDKISYVTCDAEFPSDGGIKMARTLISSFLRITASCPSNCLLVFKTFCKFPELLLHQVALWVANVRDPKIVVPTFSSFEATEVFLIGRKSPEVVNLTVNIISGVNVNRVLDLSSRRVRKRPFADAIPRSQIREIYTHMDKLGIRFNFMHAVNIFLGHACSSIPVEEGLLFYCATTIDYGNYKARRRIHAMRLMSKGRSVPLLVRLGQHSVRPDHTEIENSMLMMINANILRHLIWTNSINPSHFLKPWVLHNEKGKMIYEYQIDLEHWLQKYGRSFFKIIGYKEIMLESPTLLPEFLRITT